jgi:hypothetical protein
MDGAPFGHYAIERLKLSASDRSLEISQTEVVSDNVVPIPLILPHPVISQSAAACRKRIVSRHNHPPFAGRDRLCGLEAERARAPDGAGTAAPVTGESGFSGSTRFCRQHKPLSNEGGRRI